MSSPEATTSDLLATRTVAICFPDGETEYWLTDRVFSPGDTIDHNGRTFAVTDVATSRETGNGPRVTVQEVETNAPLQPGAEALDREAWNLPSATA